jgi:TRAP-type transport system periplasmic protein
MRRRLFPVAVSVVVLAALASASPAEAKTVLKLAHTQSTASPWHQASMRFAELVAKETNGEVEIQIFPGGQLGGIPQSFDGLKLGTVDFFPIDVALLATSAPGKSLQIMWASYVFRDQEHARKAFASPALQAIFKRVEDQTGIKTLANFGDRSPRQLTTSSTPVKTVADMKGLKIRVPQTRTLLETFKAWGAAPTPLDYTELFSGMQQGLVVGQDNGLDIIEPEKFYEVQKYLILTEHVRSILGLFMSKKGWDKLTPAQRDIVQKKANEAGGYFNELVSAFEASSVKRLQEKGMVVIRPDLTDFKRIAQEVNQRLDGDVWEKGLLKALQDIK